MDKTKLTTCSSFCNLISYFFSNFKTTFIPAFGGIVISKAAMNFSNFEILVTIFLKDEETDYLSNHVPIVVNAL